MGTTGHHWAPLGTAGRTSTTVAHDAKCCPVVPTGAHWCPPVPIDAQWWELVYSSDGHHWSTLGHGRRWVVMGGGWCATVRFGVLRFRASTKATQNATQVVTLSTLGGPLGPSRSFYVLACGSLTFYGPSCASQVGSKARV